MAVHPDACLKNIHQECLKEDRMLAFDVYAVSGDYSYYHYCIDGLDDRGWGCGYRTCQTLCSWIYFCQRESGSGLNMNDPVRRKICAPVPTIPEIQQILVEIGDKPASFVNSKEWIGSVEISMCLDAIYDVPCRLIHILPGEFGTHVDTLCEHFARHGGPLMMGGDSDNSSKGIVGVAVHQKSKCVHLLVLDPHCDTCVKDAGELWKLNRVTMLPIEQLDQKSFYNLCAPTLQRQPS